MNKNKKFKQELDKKIKEYKFFEQYVHLLEKEKAIHITSEYNRLLPVHEFLDIMHETQKIAFENKMLFTPVNTPEWEVIYVRNMKGARIYAHLTSMLSSYLLNDGFINFAEYRHDVRRDINKELNKLYDYLKELYNSKTK